MASNGKLIAALLLGAAAGTVLGVLFAPEKGSETRKKIAGKASELGDELGHRFSKGKQMANDLKDKVVNKAEEMKNAAQSGARDFRDATEEAKRAKNSSHSAS